jgi:hypothetical protein
MRGKRTVYLSGRMKRDFSLAALAALALAVIGVVLIFASLNPKPPERPKPVETAAADGCTQSLGRWNALEARLIRMAALAGDVGSRCRLLTCPELDCGKLEDLRGAVSALIGALQSVAATPAAITSPGESPACGAVVAPLAKRLSPGLKSAHDTLDLCAARATCKSLRGRVAGGAELGGLLDHIGAEADRIEQLAESLRLAESPPVAINLDLSTYSAGDAMEARIDAGRNRCLAQGGVLGIYSDTGMSALSDRPLSQDGVNGSGQTRLLLETPQSPGRYLLAVTSPSDPQRALGSAAFAVDGARHGCSGFAGRWETDRGVLTASVRRGVLRATYRRPGAVKPGFLTGQVKGRHFHGSWVSELGSGGAHLVLSSGGERFLGTAGDKPGVEDGIGLWRGHCLAARP